MIRTPAHLQSAPIATNQIAAAIVRLEDDLAALPRAERTGRALSLFAVDHLYLNNLATVRAMEEADQRRAVTKNKYQ